VNHADFSSLLARADEKKKRIARSVDSSDPDLDLGTPARERFVDLLAVIAAIGCPALDPRAVLESPDTHPEVHS